MDLQSYVILVAVAAIVYAGIVRGVQAKLVDRKKMEAIQKESKELNKEYKDAVARNDEAAIKRAMEKQMQFLPKMNKMMMGQFKIMGLILVFFFTFITVVNFFNPLTPDDITVILNDAGTECDAIAGDGIYSACYTLNDGEPGKWTVTATAFNEGSETAKKSTIFYYRERAEDAYYEDGLGNMTVSVDKEVYGSGDEVFITAEYFRHQGDIFEWLFGENPPKEVSSMTVVLDRGTWFYVDLPFTLPLFNVQRIYQPYWWFILISLVVGLVFSFILKKIIK